MTDYRSLNHTRSCQYHVVFIPKYRKKVIYGELRRHLGEVLRRLAQRRESEVEEGHLLSITCSDPAEVLGGAGDRLHQGEERDPHCPALCGPAAQFRRAALWGPGYFVSTVGRDEQAIRAYIRDQETRRTSARTASVGSA